MFPNMSPTSGIKILSLNLIRSKILININVPSRAKTKATSSFCIGVAPVNSIRDTRIPNFAESIVPAVVGETNLFRDNCCIINPAILMLTPAIISAAKRGIRLTSRVCI
ncbi:hypothetical protein D3C78_1470800 [compost metagenome]